MSYYSIHRNHPNKCSKSQIHQPSSSSSTKQKPPPAEHPPPEPPNGDYAAWDLHYCKWWGWTWVPKAAVACEPEARPTCDAPAPKKAARARPHSRRRRDPECCGGWFASCCGERPRRRRAEPERREAACQRSQASVRAAAYDDDACCMCCPCRQDELCCCACGVCFEQPKPQPRPTQTEHVRICQCNQTPPARRADSHACTQTAKAEQCCRRFRPCACSKRMCPRCQASAPRPRCQCCPCVNKNATINRNETIANYLLTNECPTTKAKYKSGPLFGKSIELLLKNNKNIMKLLGVDKNFHYQKPGTASVQSSEEISYLSTIPTTNHNALLTRVGEAILANRLEANATDSSSKSSKSHVPTLLSDKRLHETLLRDTQNRTVNRIVHNRVLPKAGKFVVERKGKEESVERKSCSSTPRGGCGSKVNTAGVGLDKAETMEELMAAIDLTFASDSKE